MSKIGLKDLSGRDGEDTNALLEAKRFDPSKKQGSYKVKIHKHSILSQLMHPLEISAAIRYKLKSKRKGVLCEAAPKGARQEDILFCEDILSSVSRSFAGVIRTATMPALAGSIVLPRASCVGHDRR